MKKQLSISVILAMALSLQAQEAKPVVIVNTTGKVALIPQAETTPMEIASGAVAKSTGQLQLGKRASGLVYCNGQFQNVKGNQTIPLSSICGAAAARRNLNFDYDFGNAMMAAVEMVAVARTQGDGWAAAVGDKPKTGDGWGAAVGDKPKTGDGWGTAVGDKPKTGDGWGTAVGDKPKTGDGWGGQGATITLILPFGKVSAAVTTFSWSMPAGNNTYQLIIMDDGKAIHRLSVGDTFAQIDLRSLKLSMGKKYQWKVTTSGDNPMNSNQLEFIVGTKEERMAAIGNGSKSEIAKSSKSHALRGLADAYALEKGQWFYDAEQKYAQLQKKQSDNMVQMMHAAFWMRYGFSFLAQKAAQG